MVPCRSWRGPSATVKPPQCILAAACHLARPPDMLIWLKPTLICAQSVLCKYKLVENLNLQSASIGRKDMMTTMQTLETQSVHYAKMYPYCSSANSIVRFLGAMLVFISAKFVGLQRSLPVSSSTT